MRKSRIALTLLAALTASFQTFASSDIESCQWGSSHCLIVSPPVLDVANDTRDNLLRLVSESKPVTLALQPVPADMTRSRSFYFGYHDDTSTLPASPAATTGDLPAALESQIAALGLDNSVLGVATMPQDQAENRHVSNTLRRSLTSMPHSLLMLHSPQSSAVNWPLPVWVYPTLANPVSGRRH